MESIGVRVIATFVACGKLLWGGGGLFSRVAGAWKREHEGDTLPVLSRVSLARLVFLVPITSKRLLRMVGGSEVGEAKREELAVT